MFSSTQMIFVICQTKFIHWQRTHVFSLLPNLLLWCFLLSFISECSIYVSSCFQVNESIDPLSAQFFMRLIIIVWFSVLFIENVESVRYYNKLKIKELAPFGSCWTFFPYLSIKFIKCTRCANYTKTNVRNSRARLVANRIMLNGSGRFCANRQSNTHIHCEHWEVWWFFASVIFARRNFSNNNYTMVEIKITLLMVFIASCLLSVVRFIAE